VRNHIVLMAVYSALTAQFFALLWKEPHERKRFFFTVFAALFVGGMVVAWVMYPFPIR
jgi:hypothetical protein